MEKSPVLILIFYEKCCIVILDTAKSDDRNGVAGMNMPVLFPVHNF